MVNHAGSQEALLHWLALHLVPGLGTTLASRLIRRLGSPQGIFHASVSELESCGLRAGVAQSIVSGVAFEEAATELEKIQAVGAEVITLQDERYPDLLKEIYDPPILLYVRGRTELLRSYKMAVVGSRRPSPYGTAVAAKLGGELAQAGLVITSGMARGVDTAAHQGALRVGGDTIAVLGCGVDVVYPAENRKLAEEIATRGLLMSESPMGTAAFPQNFPIRNRIISGMSLGVMVVEAAQYSGSLITARLAGEQGREVLAVPGAIVNKLSWGPNLLIKQGATLVQDWKDVVEAMPLGVRQAIIDSQREVLAALAVSASGETSEASGASVRVALPAVQRRLLELVQVDVGVHIDTLIGQLEEVSSASEIIGALCELELAGYLRQLPGKNYVRVW